MKLIEISSLRSRNYKKMEIEIGKKKGRRSDVKEEKIRKKVKGKRKKLGEKEKMFASCWVEEVKDKERKKSRSHRAGEVRDVSEKLLAQST